MAGSSSQKLSLRDRNHEPLPSYVLVTPARNEVSFIRSTIESVIAQTVRPLKWVIVSDGSTDGTDELVMKCSSTHEWIQLVQMPQRRGRHFAAKVLAFNAGYAELAGLKYDAIGSLDGDVSFDSDYFEFLLGKLKENPKLGIVGTPFVENGHHYDYRITSLDHVSGACQLFQRNCFEGIGGYIPIKSGGIDLSAVLTARMKGWQTRTFLEKTCEHHRKMGSAKHGRLAGAFRGGQADYQLGCDPIWQLFRSIYRLGTSRPLVLSGVLCLAGYVWAKVSGTQRALPEAVVRFRRGEERQRLRQLFGKFVRNGRAAAPRNY